ncbi:DUF3226 domain-containing protein [Bacillus sp. FSL R10-2789]|uniref:DUF3226 domain-containing protein n=1 Tax=Bacillus sp. FSL R10-2789 TaxID=2954662 RepID=UPI0030F55250
MNSLIICEGKTDSILLSYYLKKIKGWSFTTKNVPFKQPKLADNDGSVFNWYKLNDNYLGIWGVGGNSQFSTAISEILKINNLLNDESKIISKLVMMTDRDNETEAQKIQELTSFFNPHSQTPIELINNNWIDYEYKNSFQEELLMQISCLIIPFTSEGAIETFLLDALSNIDANNLSLIEEIKQFIDSLNSPYLRRDRDKLKSKFATTLAIMYPEKTFTPIDQLLTSIPWEDYKIIQEGFLILEQM